MSKNTDITVTGGATVGCDAELWRMADSLHCTMDAAEYTHVRNEVRSLFFGPDWCRKTGLPEPEFHEETGGFRVAFLKDPYTSERLRTMGLNGRQVRFCE